MPKFKILVRYRNPSYEDTVEIEANNSSEAQSACSSMMESWEARRADMESKNVYLSRWVESCDLVPRTRQQEMEALKFLEGDV